MKLKEDVICEEYRKPGLRNDGFEFYKTITELQNILPKNGLISSRAKKVI